MYGQSRREEGGDFELENPKIWVLIDGPVTRCSLGSKSNQNHQLTGFSGIKSREVELKTPQGHGLNLSWSLNCHWCKRGKNGCEKRNLSQLGNGQE